MKVLFWAGSNDGSSWYRCNQPAEALQWLGHKCQVTQQVSAELIRQADVMVVSRPAMPASHRAIAFAQENGVRVFGDIDDHFWAIDETNPIAKAFWDKEKLDGLARGLEMCDGVIVPTKALAEVVHEKVTGPSDVHVIPNGLHAGWLQAPRDYAKDELIVGWSGSQNTATWLPKIARSVNRTLNKYPNVKFMAVGVPFELLKQAGIDLIPGRVGARRWEPHGIPYLQLVQKFDIWLAPYGGTPFDQAKFPTKALEAGMHGIPLITSPIRGYVEWVDSPDHWTPTNPVMFAQDDYWMWNTAIDQLVGNAERRKAVGEAASSRAARNIMQALALDWQRVLTGGTGD